MNISALGVNGMGIIDTAAKVSVASQSLYKVLLNKGQKFYNEMVSVQLADGSS